MDDSEMGTPVPHHDIQPPSTEQLGQAPSYCSIQPAVTPLQLAGFDPIPEGPNINPTPSFNSYLPQAVSVFKDREDQGPRIEDWVRDMRDLLQANGQDDASVAFNTIAQYTSGRAREVVLNLRGREVDFPSAETVFRELLEEYGDEVLMSPMAIFYARVQQPDESPSEYAISLEATFRIARGQDGDAALSGMAYNDVLICQFMHGLRNERVHACLTSMRPLLGTFKRLRKELRIIGVLGQRTEMVSNGNCASAVPRDESMKQQQSFSEDGVHTNGGVRGFRSRSATSCYQCGQLGHFRQDCPLRQQPQEDSLLTCQPSRTTTEQQPAQETPLAEPEEAEMMRPDVVRTPEGGIRIFRPPGIDRSELFHAQRAHTAIGRVIELVVRGQEPEVQQYTRESRLVQRLLQHWNRLELEQGILVYRPPDQNGHTLLILPRKYRDQILESMHRQMGHLSFDKTLGLLKSQCYWRSLTAEVRSFAKRCRRCTMGKPSDLREPYPDESLNVPSESGEAVGGQMGPAPRATESMSSSSATVGESCIRKDKGNMHNKPLLPNLQCVLFCTTSSSSPMNSGMRSQTLKKKRC